MEVRGHWLPTLSNGAKRLAVLAAALAPIYSPENVVEMTAKPKHQSLVCFSLWPAREILFLNRLGRQPDLCTAG